MESAVVIAVPGGQSLIDALVASERRGGWWQASGVVDEVELRVAGDGADVRRRLRGKHTLVSLSGPGRGPFTVLVTRAEARGFDFAGGELVKARAVSVRAVWLPAEGLADEAPSVERRASTGATAAAEGEAGEEEGAPEPAEPEIGDLVHHFAFGWCEVVTTSGDRLKLRDASGQGRIREVVIDMLDIKGPTEKDGKRAFTLTRRV